MPRRAGWRSLAAALLGVGILRRLRRQVFVGQHVERFLDGGHDQRGLNATVLAAHAPVPLAVNGGGSSVAVFD